MAYVHTWGWIITLNPDGKRVFHSHSPPAAA